MSIISIADRRHGLDRRAGVPGSAAHLNTLAGPPPAGIRAIGIDLGTTNTVVSVFENGGHAPTTLEFEHSALIPSVLRWDGRELNIGAAALRDEGDAPTEIVRSTKRSMGKSDSKADDSGGQGSGWYRSGGREFTPEQAAAAILCYVAEHPLLQEERNNFGGLWAVITVPAHFDDAARRATLDAAAQAGLSVLRIINEPTAAALAYSFLKDSSEPGLSRAQISTNDGNSGILSEDVVVFDLGGGTFDVSVVHREDLIFKVLASEGDMALGGDDFDILLAESLAQSVQPEFLARRIERKSELFLELLGHARAIKHHLCEHVQVTLDVPVGRGMGHLAITMDRDQFETIIAPTVERTLYLTEQAIQMAKRRVRDISRILLVGGSTRAPIVRRLLESYFSPCVVDSRLEPDLAVSWGAALQAAIILGSAPETVLVDVCNHSLGIGVVDDSDAVSQHYRQVQEQFGIYEDLSESELKKKLGRRMAEFNEELQKLLRVAPIIRRNSTLPARKSEFFSTLYENQPAVHVVLAQGEGETVGENRFIGSFLFALHQPCPKGTKCEIQLTYDVNGMVHVFAKQLGVDNEAKAQFDSRSGTVSGWTVKDDEMAPDRALAPSERKESATSPTPAVLNAILARAKKLLKRKSTAASVSPHVVLELDAKTGGELALIEELRNAIANYEKSLLDSMSGRVDEAAVDQLETELLQLMATLEC